MTDAIIEAAARAMPSFWDDGDKLGTAMRVLAAVTPLIRAQVLEEAAKVAEAHKLGDNAMLTGTSIWAVHEGACIEIAAAIRTLKEQP